MEHPKDRKFGQIIILNGAPRSGKSSIVQAIQDTYEGVWVNLGVDRFMEMTPGRYLPGIGLRPGGERPDLEPLIPNLYRSLYGSIAAHSRAGLNVAVDVGHHDAYSRPLGILPACARMLRDFPVLFVGVHCPVEVIIERRHATGWDKVNLDDDTLLLHIQSWQKEVHIPGIYDMEVDTSVMSPLECAELIKKRLEEGLPLTAFQRLVAMADQP